MVAVSKNDKNERWPKQFGDFAEGMVMYLLGRLKGMSVALIDHVGADIIAADKESKEVYAISVKGRNIPEKESKGRVFTFDDIKKLRKTAENFGMTPAVAFVFVDDLEKDQDNKGIMKIRIFLITLDDLEKNAKCESGFLREVKKGIGIRYEKKHSARTGEKSHLDQIKDCKFIDYTELIFTHINNKAPFLN